MEPDHTAIGVDVGGSGIKGAIVDVRAGKLLGERIRIPTPHPATPDAIAATIGELTAELSHPGPIGITLPAVVRRGVVETAANIDPAWIGTDAPALLAPVTKSPVTVLNDADAAGLAEVTFGAGHDRTGVILVCTLGTGIGSALFVDGTLVPNTELGHIHLHHHGDAETWAAASVREQENLSWSDWASRLERYFGQLEALLQPDLIIVGGGVSRKADKFLPRIAINTELIAATLENQAGIVGAAMCATTT